MNFDARVLRAMLRLARRRQAADEADIAVRAGQTPGAVRASLRRLDGQGLVERRAGAAPRLTLEGLALALALLPRTATTQKPALRTPRAA